MPPRRAIAISHRGNARAIMELLLIGKPVVLWTAFAITEFSLMQAGLRIVRHIPPSGKNMV